MYIKSMITRYMTTRIATMLLCLLFSLLMSTTAQAEQMVSALSIKSEAVVSPAALPAVDPRLRQLLSDAINSSDSFDDRFHAEVWLMDIYPAREEPLEGIDSQWLLGLMDTPHKKWVSADQLIEKIKEASPEVLVTMGAGDIGLQAQPIQNALSHAS